MKRYIKSSYSYEVEYLIPKVEIENFTKGNKYQIFDGSYSTGAYLQNDFHEMEYFSPTFIAENFDLTSEIITY